MYTVSKTFSFCYGHRLYGDESRCRHLHGHTAKASIIVSKEGLDDRGMVVHFGELKQSVGRWIDDEIDHTMLLWEGDPLCHLLADKGERLIKLPFHPTAENLARYIYEKVKALGFPVMQVEMWESETSRASYGEAHGANLER